MKNGMDGMPGKHISYWIDTSSETSYPQLLGEIKTDVLVIGGGMAGLNIAYALRKSGKEVIVLEGNKIGRGVSGHTTAHITSAHGMIYSYLKDSFGLEDAKTYAEANEKAISIYEEIIKENKLKCDFERTDEYIYAAKKKELSELKKEFEVAKEIGLPVEFLKEAPIGIKTYGAIRYSNQAQFHPCKYMQGLAKVLDKEGASIFEGSRVRYIEKKNMIAFTLHGSVKAKYIVIATHVPILDKGFYFSRMRYINSYVIASEIGKQNIDGMFDSTEDPSHYIRRHDNTMIIGGEDHLVGKNDDTSKSFSNLHEYVKDNFGKKITYHWDTQDNYTFDQVPFIGKWSPAAERMFVATGFKGWGMTHSIIASKIITDLILKRENPWIKLYDPLRMRPFKILDFTKMNAKVAAEFIKGKIKKTKDDLDDLERGSGDQFDIGGRKVGVYRDEKDVYHSVDLKCKHLGCTVRWNNADKTWDCPCHSSRFDVDGKLLHGPALEDLDKEDIGK